MRISNGQKHLNNNNLHSCFNRRGMPYIHPNHQNYQGGANLKAKSTDHQFNNDAIQLVDVNYKRNNSRCKLHSNNCFFTNKNRLKSSTITFMKLIALLEKGKFHVVVVPSPNTNGSTFSGNVKNCQAVMVLRRGKEIEKPDSANSRTKY